MNLKKPSFWDLPKPNFLSYLLIPFSLPIMLRNFFHQFLKKKKSQKNIKDKINKIGQKILEKNIVEINLILNKA